jgi:hypothetical protein
MTALRPILLSFLLAATPMGAMAQAADEGTSPEEERGEMGEGLSLIDRGARMLLRGLMAELEPALRDLGSTIDDLSAYHAPEVMPNGDIIIRRKVPLTPPPGDDEVDI